MSSDHSNLSPELLREARGLADADGPVNHERIARALAAHERRGAAAEREAVVAWCCQWGPSDIMWEVADEIKRGDHHADKPPRPSKDAAAPAPVAPEPPIACRQCGREVEPQRRVYVVPTCYACLPPPPPIPTIPWPPSRAPSPSTEPVAPRTYGPDGTCNCCKQRPCDRSVDPR